MCYNRLKLGQSLVKREKRPKLNFVTGVTG